MQNTNQLKKLSREELVDILLLQTEENETLKAENDALRERLAQCTQDLETLKEHASKYLDAFSELGLAMSSSVSADAFAERIAQQVAKLLQSGAS